MIQAAKLKINILTLPAEIKELPVLLLDIEMYGILEILIEELLERSRTIMRTKIVEKNKK
jgi:hypothetical protein